MSENEVNRTGALKGMMQATSYDHVLSNFLFYTDHLLLGQKVMERSYDSRNVDIYKCQGENLLGSSHLEDSANELH